MTQLDKNDTICAISTPPGRGGIAVARVSGPDTIDIIRRIWRGKDITKFTPRTAHLGTILDTTGEPLDQALVTVYRSPASFTGEESAEISVHGSTYIQSELLQSLITAGARLAEPGEYTRRAFVNGRFDLAQAEAIADLIASESRAAARIAVKQMNGTYSRRIASLRADLIDLASLLELELDFSEEDVEFASRDNIRDTAIKILNEVNRLAESYHTGNAIRQGIPVAIVGATNAGKSSLLNRLIDDDRAIVSDLHGTTRDTIEAMLHIGAYTFRLIDTAGLRETSDPIELLGIERSLGAINRASVVLHVIDSSQPLSHDDSLTTFNAPNASDAVVYTIYNKADIQHEYRGDLDEYSFECSALTGQGISEIKTALLAYAEQSIATSDILVTNARHYQSLRQAAESIRRVIEALDAQISGELIAQDMRQTIDHLSSITGQITSDTLLHSIFTRFCIGK